MKDLIDSTSKYYNTISFHKAKKELTNEQLVKFLCKLGFYEEKSDQFKDQIKKMNPEKYNSADNVYNFFASIIFKGKCYLMTEKYINEVSDVIQKTLIKVGEENLYDFLKQYALKNEYFLGFEEHQTFYREQYDNLVKKSIDIRNTYGDNAYDAYEKMFSDQVIELIKNELHSCSSYNLNYLTGNDLGLDLRGTNCFLSLVNIVGVQRQLDYVRNQLQKTEKDISNTETYTTQEIVCFFDIMNMILHEGEKSFRKQAKIISKLTGKNERNIRDRIARIGNKDYRDQVLKSNQKVYSDLKELGYPLGRPQ